MRLILLLFMVVGGSFLRCSMPHHQDEFFGDVEFVFKGRYVNSLTESHTSIELSEAGYKLKFSNIPVDQYSALSFGIGVPSNLNSKNPSQFDINHPLGEGSHYWSGWKSYIFSKTEGVMTNGTDATNFAYHSGFDSAYRSFEFQINIAQDPIFHDGGPFMITFMNNYQSSIHL